MNFSSKFNKIINKTADVVAFVLLLIMFLLALFSVKDDTFTFDETAHVAAGYSYLTQKDYRLNPEHPPLIKDLAAFPLLFLGLSFPKDEASWIQQEPPPWWMQFDFASQFLYKAGNNPDQIMFWSKLAMIILLVFFGWFIFYSTKKLFNNKVAVISLFFYCFSPTFLAHGRLITTDVGAALGVVLSTYFWLKFLKNSSIKNTFLTGIIFCITMLIKFSLITLIPFLAFITIVYAWLFTQKNHLINFLKYLGKTFLIALTGIILVIYPVYFHHTFNLPHQQQLRDTEFLLSHSSIPHFLQEINIWLVKNDFFRPLGHYILGLLLGINRSTTGHTTFFLGEISAQGWKTYFPVVYAIKEPLAFHILTLIALLYLALLIKKPFWQNSVQKAKEWIRFHFVEFTMLAFLAIYWLTSLNTKLNIGIRHLLPAFPFTFILIANVLTLILKPPYLKIKYAVLSAFFVWQIISVISVFPHFLAYFNELVGGPENGYLYVVNSNIDWGQDLKRLKKWLQENKIDKIYLDYFGGGNPDYYLKEKYLPWWGNRDSKELLQKSYLAISVNQLQGGRAFPVKGYEPPSDYYMWLYRYEPPIAKIGYSIFVYYIE